MSSDPDSESHLPRVGVMAWLEEGAPSVAVPVPSPRVAGDSDSPSPSKSQTLGLGLLVTVRWATGLPLAAGA